jgi:hypothetical protein
MSEKSLRARRGLGPFSGAQLTVIIVVFAVLLLAPIGAWAVSGSNVFVTDAGSGQRAFVSGSGQVNVTRAGAKSFFTHVSDPSTGVFQIAAKPPSGRALVVTSIAVDAYRVLATGVFKNFSFALSTTNATCATTGEFVADVNPATVGVTVLPFDPGLVVPSGRSLCVKNGDTTNLRAEVYVYGYLIPASAAPAGTASLGGAGIGAQMRGHS